jgi:hypothetical protein
MTGDTFAGVRASKTEEHIVLGRWSSERRRRSHIFVCLLYVEVSFLPLTIIPCKNKKEKKTITNYNDQ